MAHLHPDTRTVPQIFASSVLQMGGESPKHVAIIMDGNRRYATSLGCETIVGHKAGSEKFKEVSRWCYEMKIPELTVYAFSIENFKRSEKEVEMLMALFHAQCLRLISDLDDYKKSDICIHFIGNWKLVPAKLKPNMAKLMVETKHCKTFKLNIAFAYTGRNGIEQSVANIEKGIQDGQLLLKDVTEYLMDEAQNLLPMRPVDIMIRTGGDSRISDFMMWEASHAYIHFMDVPWPDMTFWQFWKALFEYQMYRRDQPRLPPSYTALTEEQKKKADKFLENIREKKWDRLNRFSKKADAPTEPSRNHEETLFREAFKQLFCFPLN